MNVEKSLHCKVTTKKAKNQTQQTNSPKPSPTLGGGSVLKVRGNCNLMTLIPIG